MFEKEAEEYAEGMKTEKELEVLNTVHYWGEESLDPNERRLFEGVQDRKRAREQGFKDGAEFGYNKANEWNTETPSSAVGNKDILLRVAKDDFDVGYYHFENQKFYTNDGREVTPLAWKVIVLPERKPEVEG